MKYLPALSILQSSRVISLFTASSALSKQLRAINRKEGEDFDSIKWKSALIIPTYAITVVKSKLISVSQVSKQKICHLHIENLIMFSRLLLDALKNKISFMRLIASENGTTVCSAEI